MILKPFETCILIGPRGVPNSRGRHETQGWELFYFCSLRNAAAREPHQLLAGV